MVTYSGSPAGLKEFPETLRLKIDDGPAAPTRVGWGGSCGTKAASVLNNSPAVLPAEHPPTHTPTHPHNHTSSSRRHRGNHAFRNHLFTFSASHKDAAGGSRDLKCGCFRAKPSPPRGYCLVPVFPGPNLEPPGMQLAVRLRFLRLPSGVNLSGAEGTLGLSFLGGPHVSHFSYST